jgi:hypothetical protein
MNGIMLSHGVLFVQYEGVTIRVRNGECDISPIMYESLEWDLRTESGDKWWYVSEDEIKSMDSEIYEKIIKKAEWVNSIIYKK